MLTKNDARRRWFGLLFLALAAGLLIWGQTVLQPHLRGVWFLLYWAACSVLTLLAIATALLDILIIRRRARDEHRDLVRRSFDLPGQPPASSRSNEKNSHD
jgi:protein-S-isoprenylcysteine O-methyltransferase Ste14